MRAQACPLPGQTSSGSAASEEAEKPFTKSVSFGQRFERSYSSTLHEEDPGKDIVLIDEERKREKDRRSQELRDEIRRESGGCDAPDEGSSSSYAQCSSSDSLEVDEFDEGRCAESDEGSSRRRSRGGISEKDLDFPEVDAELEEECEPRRRSRADISENDLDFLQTDDEPTREVSRPRVTSTSSQQSAKSDVSEDWADSGALGDVADLLKEGRSELRSRMATTEQDLDGGVEKVTLPPGANVSAKAKGDKDDEDEEEDDEDYGGTSEALETMERLATIRTFCKTKSAMKSPGNSFTKTDSTPKEKTRNKSVVFGLRHERRFSETLHEESEGKDVVAIEEERLREKRRIQQEFRDALRRESCALDDEPAQSSTKAVAQQDDVELEFGNSSDDSRSRGRSRADIDENELDFPVDGEDFDEVRRNSSSDGRSRGRSRAEISENDLDCLGGDTEPEEVCEPRRRSRADINENELDSLEVDDEPDEICTEPRRRSRADISENDLDSLETGDEPDEICEPRRRSRADISENDLDSLAVGDESDEEVCEPRRRSRADISENDLDSLDIANDPEDSDDFFAQNDAVRHMTSTGSEIF